MTLHWSQAAPQDSCCSPAPELTSPKPKDVPDAYFQLPVSAFTLFNGFCNIKDSIIWMDQ